MTDSPAEKPVNSGKQGNGQKAEKPAKLPLVAWDSLDDGKREFIINDLANSGFASELKARKIFKENGFTDVRAFFYSDRDQEKSRELDVIAVRPKPPHRHVNFSHTIVAEVKRGYTWIAGDSIDEETIALTSSLPLWYNDLVEDKAPSSALEDLNGIVSGEDLRAPLLTSTLMQREKDEAWYAAATAVFKACVGLPKPTSNAVTGLRSPDISMIIPLIVLDGNLLRASLHPETGAFQVDTCERLQFSFTYESDSYERTSMQIQIVTMAGLHSFLAKVIEVENQGCNLCQQTYVEYSKQPPRRARIRT